MDSTFITRIATGLPGFLIAIVFHEAAHAWMATRYGDDTAKRLGRLSLNPVVHYDLVGTIIFPLIGALIGGVMFGWAKPVPVDARNFKNIKKGIFWVSFAGPLANLVMAVICGFLYAVVVTKLTRDFYLYDPFRQMLEMAIYINIIIAVFNLIPFPPLDGAKMVSTFLNYEAARKFENLQNFSFLFIIILWTTNIFSYIVSPALLIGHYMTRVFISLLG